MHSIKAMIALTFLTTSLCFANDTNNEVILSKERLQLRGNVKHDPFVINAIPKCGTHLIGNCISLMLNKTVDEGYDYVSEKNYTPEKAKKYLAFLKSLKTSPIIHKTHMPFFPAIEKTLRKSGLKSVFIIRDPRDAIVSLLFYMEAKFKNSKNRNRRDFMTIDSDIYDKLSLDEKITALMTGSCCTNYLELYLKPFVGWAHTDCSFVVKFEDLIGVKGGGTYEKQLNVINEIASYLNVQLSPTELAEITECTNMYETPLVQNSLGTSYIKGQIGSWDLYFSESNKKLFKKLLGKQLIELGYEMNNNW